MDIRKIISSEDVNTGRQFEADMAKFMCMIGMVIVHCFDAFISFSEVEGSIQFAFATVLNVIFGAVFALGVCDLLSVLLSEKMKSCITRVSKNITIIYFLQWVILSVLVSIRSFGQKASGHPAEKPVRAPGGKTLIAHRWTLW